jgi:hypothetical protein
MNACLSHPLASLPSHTQDFAHKLSNLRALSKWRHLVAHVVGGIEEGTQQIAESPRLDSKIMMSERKGISGGASSGGGKPPIDSASHKQRGDTYFQGNRQFITDFKLQNAQGGRVTVKGS